MIADPKTFDQMKEAALRGGRFKLGEQHRRKRQSDKDKLRAEIERLRAALKEIQVLWCKGETVQIGAIARRALEPKP